MKKKLYYIALIVCLCSVAWLGLSWADGATRSQVVTGNAVALALVAASGLYLKKHYKEVEDGQMD